MTTTVFRVATFFCRYGKPHKQLYWCSWNKAFLITVITEMPNSVHNFTPSSAVVDTKSWLQTVFCKSIGLCLYILGNVQQYVCPVINDLASQESIDDFRTEAVAVRSFLPVGTILCSDGSRFIILLLTICWNSLWPKGVLRLSEIGGSVLVWKTWVVRC